jgi:outer membrane protein, heavy metal efflux system
MARRSCTIVVIALASLPLGCATIVPRPGFDTVSELVSARSPGHTVVWNQGTADDQAAAEHVAALLAGELTLDSAIQIALLDNRALQAVYAQLGIAQADVVQAGLLQNPILSADVRFPTAQGAAIGAAAGLVQEFISMLQIPLRKRVAAAAFDEATLTASAAVIDLVTAVKRTFYRLEGAEQLLELRRTVVDATALSADVARRQHDAGNVTDLDLANERALAEQARADLARVETEVAEDREELSALMGLWGADATRWRISSRLPELPPDDVAPDTLEGIALSQRLDLAAARQRIRTVLLERELSRAFRWLPSAALGVAAEREVEDGVWSIGPSVELTVPIFDQGQAALARRTAELGQRENEHAAMEVTVRSQVRRARTRMDQARRLAEHYRTVLLPLRSKIIQQTQLEYNAMLAGVFQLLLAKRDEIDAGASYIEALRDYWLARTELESAVGGELVADTGQQQQPHGG